MCSWGLCRVQPPSSPVMSPPRESRQESTQTRAFASLAFTPHCAISLFGADTVPAVCMPQWMSHNTCQGQNEGHLRSICLENCEWMWFTVSPHRRAVPAAAGKCRQSALWIESKREKSLQKTEDSKYFPWRPLQRNGYGNVYSLDQAVFYSGFR